MTRTLPDVQALGDHRGLGINQTGVTGFRCPVAVADPVMGKQNTVAQVTASIPVSADARGAHLSRFVEVLHSSVADISMVSMGSLVREIAQRMGTNEAAIQLQFPYFVSRPAPVTQKTGFLDIDCEIDAELQQDRVAIRIGATTPITTLCPCSKAVSDYGAHNQRTYVSVHVEPLRDSECGSLTGPWFDELIEASERSGSSPVYPLLKRPDERFVTMHAYEHPAFVEDVIRDLALELQKDIRIGSFDIDVRSVESIHSHDAFARIRWEREQANLP
jgi:GTP cyclohydrolase I